MSSEEILPSLVFLVCADEHRYQPEVTRAWSQFDGEGESPSDSKTNLDELS